MGINFIRPRGVIPAGYNAGLKIDWSHPLSVGLIGCWVPGVSLIDLCLTGLDLQLGSSTFGVSPEGPCIDGILGATGTNYGAASGDIPSAHPLLHWSRLTWYYRGMTNAASGSIANSFQRLLNIAYDNANGNPYSLAGAYFNSGTTIAPMWNIGGGFVTGVNFTLSLPIYTEFSIASTYVAGGNQQGYFNGAISGGVTGVGPGVPSYSATSQIDIAGDFAYPNSAALKTYMVAFWNRDLSAAEIAYLDADPYCFLVPSEGEWSMVKVPPVVAVTIKGGTLPFMGVG